MQASESNRRIIKNTKILYFRMLFMMGLGFYTSRLVLDELGAIDYGLYFVVGGITAMTAMLNGSMAGATQRWITIALGKDDQDYLKKVFSVGMSAQLTIMVSAIILCESLGLWYLHSYAVIPQDRIDATHWVFQISVATIALQVISVPFLGVILAHERMSALAYFSLIDAVVKVLICLMLPAASADKLIVYAALLFMGQCIQFATIQIFCQRNFEEARFRFGWDMKLYKDMWRLAFWSFSGNIAYILYTQGLTLLINYFFGPAMNAAAGIAAQAGNKINQFRTNFQQAMAPQITKTFAQENFFEMETLVIRSSKFSHYLMLVLAVPVFLEAPFLLDLWLKEVPDHAVGFLRIGLLAAMVMAIRAPLVTAAMASGDLKKYQLVVISILLTICPVSYLLLSLGAIPETTTIVLASIMLIATVASARMLRPLTHLDFKRFMSEVLLSSIYITALCFIAPGIFHLLMKEGWGRLIIVGSVSTISTLIIVYITGLKNNEKLYFKAEIVKRISIFLPHPGK